MNLYEAKTQLSLLVEEVASGRDVVIARAGRLTARGQTHLLESLASEPLVLLTNDVVLAGYGEVVQVVRTTVDSRRRGLSDSPA